MATGDGTWSVVAFYTIGAGTIGGLLAAVFGTIDWLAIPQNTRAKRLGFWHGAGNALVVALFIVSWLLRRGAPDHPPASAIILSILAVALGAVTGWLGGELVDRLGIGVDDGANPNAPSSLTVTSGLVARHRKSGGINYQRQRDTVKQFLQQGVFLAGRDSAGSSGHRRSRWNCGARAYEFGKSGAVLSDRLKQTGFERKKNRGSNNRWAVPRLVNPRGDAFARDRQALPIGWR
jgi:uncharacterized membrane protein